MLDDPAEEAKRILNRESGFKELAKMAFDMHKAFMKVGFKDKQALYLTSEWLSNTLRNSKL